MTFSIFSGDLLGTISRAHWHMTLPEDASVDVYEIEPTLASRWIAMFVRAAEKAPKADKAEL